MDTLTHQALRRKLKDRMRGKVIQPIADPVIDLENDMEVDDISDDGTEIAEIDEITIPLFDTTKIRMSRTVPKLLSLIDIAMSEIGNKSTQWSTSSQTHSSR